jgi:hypothetical protein
MKISNAPLRDAVADQTVTERLISGGSANRPKAIIPNATATKFRVTSLPCIQHDVEHHQF